MGTTNIDLGNFTGSSWTVHTHTFTPTDNSLVLTFSSTTSNNGGNFLDAVSLKDTDTDTDVVVNGSFEQFTTGNVGDKGQKGFKGDKGSTPSLVSTNMVLHLDSTNPSSYGGSGTQWTDISGQNNHGTLNGGVSFTDSEYMDFDGQDGSFVEMTNGLTLARAGGTLCFDIYKMRQQVVSFGVPIMTDISQPTVIRCMVRLHPTVTVSHLRHLLSIQDSGTKLH